MRRCGFYIVADSAFYVGAAAALNSLRLVGHQQPAFVLDVGLTETQRKALGQTAEVIPCPKDVAPRLAKWVAPLAEPSDVMVVLDADVIVTRPLDSLLDEAARGSVVAFADFWVHRFYDEWAGFVGASELPRRTYVNSGFFALPRGLGLDVLTNVRTAQLKLAQLGYTDLRNDEDPSLLFAYPDQDSWNAVLSAIVPDDAFSIWPHELAPFPQDRTAVVDKATLSCRAAGGERPYLLHHIGKPKPWVGPISVHAYTRLLPRVLFGEDVVVRLDPSDLPLGVRPGARASVERLRLQVRGEVQRRARRLRHRLRSGLIRAALARLTQASRGSRRAGRARSRATR